MGRNVFIIHGAYGSPNENWIPWLKKELKQLGKEVIVPTFPTPRGQVLERWLEVFGNFEDKVGEETILIGHSIGATFLLSVLEKLQSPIHTSFLVSGFIGPLNNPKFDKINKTFAEKEFNWPKIRSNCQKFHIIHGDNDPYVLMGKAEELAKNLGVEVEVIKNGGHLNKSAGYTKFEYLIRLIKSAS